MVVSAADCFKICLADLNKKCQILTHQIVETGIGDIAAGSQLTEIFDGWFKVETVNIQGTVRFSGVNINRNTTHIFSTRLRNSLVNLDAAGENFIKKSNRLFKVLEITNLNEDDEWIIFQCVERGLDTKEASNA